MVRLRQVVLAARELDPVVQRLRDELGVGEPFHDPGVGFFGLRNAVCALGDTFVEVVSPKEEGTTAGRYLDRQGGDCGYMLIFQFPDQEALDAARTRVRAMELRVVWQADHEDISGTHLHPADMRGAIVSLDRATPPGLWRWGGPAWTERVGEGPPGRVVGATIDVTDPEEVAERWAAVLGVEREGPTLPLDGATIEFRESGDEGLTGFAVELPSERRRDRDEVTIGGVRFSLRSSSGA